MRHRTPLTYANVVSTIALLLAMSGGSHSPPRRSTPRTSRPTPVTHRRSRRGGHRQAARRRGVPRAADAVPGLLKQSPSSGSAPVTNGPDPYPISKGSWTQEPGEINVIFGAADATLAYDGSGNGACEVYFDIRINGQQVGFVHPAGSYIHRAGERPSPASSSPLTLHRSGQRRAERVDDADRLQRRLHPEVDDRLDPLPGPRLRLIRRWTPGKRAALAARGTLPCRSHLPTAATVRPARDNRPAGR